MVVENIDRRGYIVVAHPPYQQTLVGILDDCSPWQLNVFIRYLFLRLFLFDVKVKSGRGRCVGIVTCVTRAWLLWSRCDRCTGDEFL